MKCIILISARKGVMTINNMATQPIKNGNISSGWGERTLHGVKEFHYGIDITPTIDKNVYCAKDGKIVWIDKAHRIYDKEKNTGSFGLVVYIEYNNDNWIGIYPHMDSINLNIQLGDNIKEGDKIGIVGNTGFSYGVHLHYQEQKRIIKWSEKREPKDIIELY